MSRAIGEASRGAVGRAVEPPAPAAEPEDGAPESHGRARCVLVMLHGRRAHAGAIAMARLIARALRAPLHGLFVGCEPIAASDVPAYVGVTPEALRGVVIEVAAVADPVEALAAATEGGGASFVVVPSEPGPSDERLGIGRLAAFALKTSACGVVIVGEATFAPRLQRILLPLDGAPSTAAVIAPVGELARWVGAELDIVMVGRASPGSELEPSIPPLTTPAPPEPGAMMPPLYIDQAHHEWAAFTDEFMHRFLTAIGRCPDGVSTRFFLNSGEPAAEILRMAVELKSDLVVLVWHGQLDGEHGGVFCRVLRNAPCPMLVLKR